MSEINNNDSIQNLSPELQKAYRISAKAVQRPVQQAEERKSVVESRLKLLDDVIGRVEGVRSLVPGLNSAFAIKQLAVGSDDEAILTGVADKSIADPGKHTLEVIELAKPARAISNRFPDKDETQVGSGYFVFETLDGEEKEVFIDNENSTLENIAKIINQAGTGMKASVVNDATDLEAPYRLILSKSETGKGEDVDYPEFYFIDGEEDFYIEEEHNATNARFKYEGFELESPSNEIDDLVPGVTLNLKGMTGEGKTVSLTVEQDVPATVEKIKGMVDGVNKVLGFIQEQNDLDENSDTLRTLGADYGMRLSEGRIRQAMRENFLFVPGRNIQTLSDIGIEFNKEGLLDFDEKKATHSVNTHYDEVVQILAGDGATYGMVTKLSKALKSLVIPGQGMLRNQQRNYQDQVKRVDREIDSKSKRAQERLERVKMQLANAQVAMNRIQGQGQYIQQTGSPLLQASLAQG